MTCYATDHCSGQYVKLLVSDTICLNDVQSSVHVQAHAHVDDPVTAAVDHWTWPWHHCTEAHDAEVAVLVAVLPQSDLTPSYVHDACEPACGAQQSQMLQDQIVPRTCHHYLCRCHAQPANLKLHHPVPTLQWEMGVLQNPSLQPPPVGHRFPALATPMDPYSVANAMSPATMP